MENGIQKYDWDALKRNFFNSDHLEVASFIRQTLGKETAEDGNMARQTKGWTEDKKEWKRKRAENIQKQVDKALIEKLKISLEDLLINKKLLFSLDSKYLEILGRMAQANLEKPISPEELIFFRNYQESVRDVYKRIQIELGLPVNIEELQGAKDKPLVFVELVRQAENALKDAEQRRNNKSDTGGDGEPRVGN